MAYNYTALPSPVINYITNSTADNDTVGWATYADAAQTTPVDGTGGSPQSSLWIRSTTSPLRKNASFRLDKTGSASRQGQGVSFDFTIDKADTAKVLTVSFDYEVAAGTYANGDVTVYIYDVTNATVIQPAGYIVQNVASGTENKHIATFQTHATSTSYRLILHIASTSAQNYTLAIDNVVVGPQTVQYGAPITDWQSYTPTLTNAGNATATGRYRRVGDSIEAAIRVVIGSSLPTGNIFYSLPTGLSLDLTKFPNNGSNNEILGYAQGGAANLSHVGVVLLTSSNQVGVYGDDGSDIWNATNPITWANGNQIQINFRAPIAGFSSTVQMSNDTDTRVVAAIYTGNASQSVTSGTTDIPYKTKIDDTHGAWDGSKFVCPVPGFYAITARVRFNTSPAGAAIQLFKNGTLVCDTNDNRPDREVHSCNAMVYANAGDTLSLRSTTSGNLTDSSANHRIEIRRVSGPSAIAATETVVMRAYKNTGSQTSNANWQTVASYNASPIDSHGAFNTTTGEYTAPVSGTYQVSTTMGLLSNATGIRGVKIQVDGLDSIGGNIVAAVSGANTMVVSSGIVKVNAGQKITASVYQSSGGNLAYETTANYSHLSIVRVGN